MGYENRASSWRVRSRSSARSVTIVPIFSRSLTLPCLATALATGLVTALAAGSVPTVSAASVPTPQAVAATQPSAARATAQTPRLRVRTVVRGLEHPWDVQQEAVWSSGEPTIAASRPAEFSTDLTHRVWAQEHRGRRMP